MPPNVGSTLALALALTWGAIGLLGAVWRLRGASSRRRRGWY